MKDPEITRQNALSDADLAADCRQRIGQARLDLADLQREGATAADLNAFEAEVAQFETLPSDDDLEYARMALREKRDAALEAGRSALRDVLGPVRRAYGDASPQVKRFGAARLSAANAAEVFNLLGDAQTTGAQYLSDETVTREGFGQARLDALAPAQTAVQQAQKAFLDADQIRLEGTRARVLAYNALDTRCAHLCARGYDHYVERNATKARAYVRNPAPRTGGEGPASPGEVGA